MPAVLRPQQSNRTVRSALEGALEPCVARLVSQARSRTGIEILLLFANDHMACDTCHGLAMRLACSFEDVGSALESLVAGGVLRLTHCPTGIERTYWLAEDPHVHHALNGLTFAYHTDTSTREYLCRRAASSAEAGPWASPVPPATP